MPWGGRSIRGCASAPSQISNLACTVPWQCLYFFSCFPVFFAIGLFCWVAAITGVIWGGLSVPLSKQLAAQCPDPGPRGGLPCHALHISGGSDRPWPWHRGKNMSPGLGETIRDSAHPKVALEPQSHPFPTGCAAPCTAQTDVPEVTNASRALGLQRDSAEPAEAGPQHRWHCSRSSAGASRSHPMASPEHLSCHLPTMLHWDLNLRGRWPGEGFARCQQGTAANEATPGERAGSGEKEPPGPPCEWGLED